MSVIFGQTEYEELYTNHTRDWFANAPNFGYYGMTLLGLYEKQLLSTGQDYFIVGVGFGRWVEYMIDELGFSSDNVRGTELSSYVHSLIDDPLYVNQTYKNLILNLDISSPTILDDLKAIFGGNGKISGAVITGLVLSCMETDQELLDFHQDCLDILGPQATLLHLVFTDKWDGQGFDPMISGRNLGMNFRTRSELESLIGSECWMLDINNGLDLWRPTDGWVKLSEVT